MKNIAKKALRFAWKFIRTVLLVILIPIVLYAISWSYHRIHAAIHSKESRWMHDLGNFEESLLNKHVNPNWISAGTQERIQQGIDSLRRIVAERKGDVSLDSMRIGMMQISALLQDGHTHLANYIDDTGSFPISLQFYKEGLFVVAADSTLANLIGLRVVAVNEHSIDKVIDRIRTICPSPNFSSQKMYIETYCKRPGLLYGLGLSSSNRTVVFHLEDPNGKQIVSELNGFAELKGQVTMESLHQGNEPLHLQNNKKAYWYVHDPKNDLVYMKYNRVMSMPNDPMGPFVDRLMHLLDSVEVKKFIIDVRNNPGGDNFLTSKLVTEIQRRPNINRRGVLYAITGHQTFSAAICFVGNLSTHTQVTFVGIPFGDYSNLPGDAKFFDFHMNRITWQVSELFWENTYFDDVKNSLPLDLPYETSFMEDFSGANPMIELILTDSSGNYSQPWKTSDALKLSYNGRYQFSPDKTLQLDLDHGKMKLSGGIESELAYVNDTIYRVRNLRFNLILSKQEVYLMRDDSVKRVLNRLGANEFTALELIEKGEYEKARAAYLKLKEQYEKGLPAISGNNLSTTANYLYLITGNNEMQIELLKIAIEMYPNEMMPLGRMATAKSINQEGLSSILYRIRSLWYFDWKNLDNYGKAFGFF